MAVALVALAFPAQATAQCAVSTSQATVTLDAGLRVYVVHDDCRQNCLFSEWVYVETNGIPGLQRSDPYRDDTCGGAFSADHILL